MTDATLTTTVTMLADDFGYRFLRSHVEALAFTLREWRTTTGHALTFRVTEDLVIGHADACEACRSLA